MKKALIALPALLLIAVAGYFYFTSRFHYLPEWYEQGEYTQSDTLVGEPEIPLENGSLPEDAYPEGSVTPPDPPLPAPTQKQPDSRPTAKTRVQPPKTSNPQGNKTVDRISRELSGNEPVKISAAELDQIVALSIAQMMPGQNADFLKAVKSSIGTEKIDLEMIVDVNKIPWEQLPSQARLAQTLLTQLASTSNSELYMKVSGAPVAKEEQLGFDDNSTIQIGKISYPLKTFLAMPGINQIVPSRIPLKSVPFKTVSLEEGFLVLGK